MASSQRKQARCRTPLPSARSSASSARDPSSETPPVSVASGPAARHNLLDQRQVISSASRVHCTRGWLMSTKVLQALDPMREHPLGIAVEFM